MSIFVTSDSHFNSENIIKYCNRPFKSAEDQNAELIRRWNSVVDPGDTVIHLGDFILGQSETIPKILGALNGQIILTRGNHDVPSKLRLYAEYPEKIIVQNLHYLQHKSLFFIFSHFPMVHPEFMDMMVKDNSEVVYCHGHIHDKSPFFNPETHSFNCCVEATDFTPVPISKFYQLMKQHLVDAGVWRRKD